MRKLTIKEPSKIQIFVMFFIATILSMLTPSFNFNTSFNPSINFAIHLWSFFVIMLLLELQIYLSKQEE